MQEHVGGVESAPGDFEEMKPLWVLVVVPDHDRTNCKPWAAEGRSGALRTEKNQCEEEAESLLHHF